jgi:uncharacterized membrane protein YkvA (DUF1232 family)
VIEFLKRVLDDEVTADRVAQSLRQHAYGVPVEDVERVAAVVAEVVRTVPDALSWAFALAKDERCGRAVRFATGSVVHYLLDSNDLLPEAELGPLGLADDAFLVHAFVARVAQMYPFAGVSLPSGLAEPDTMRVVAALLPDGVAEALVRTCDSITFVAEALFGSGPAPAAQAPVVELQIRVAEAARAMKGLAREAGVAQQ